MYEHDLNMARCGTSNIQLIKIYGIEINLFLGKYKPGHCVFKTRSVH